MADFVTKDNLARCTICGTRFKPFNRHHHLCSYKCRDAYNLQRKPPAERPVKECMWCHEQFIPNRVDQSYCNLKCSNKAKAAEAKAARLVWWKVGRPTLRELEAAGVDGAGAKRRWNAPTKKPKPDVEKLTPEQQKEVDEALAEIMNKFTPKIQRRF